LYVTVDEQEAILDTMPFRTMRVSHILDYALDRRFEAL
jgi:hypothetical protein